MHAVRACPVAIFYRRAHEGRVGGALCLVCWSFTLSTGNLEGGGDGGGGGGGGRGGGGGEDGKK